MDINLIGVPLKYGSDGDGVDKSPDILRDEGIIDLMNRNGHISYDMGNIFVPHMPAINKYLDHHEIKYLDTIAIVNENLANNVYCSLKSNKFPFILGGDHSLSIGSIAGASKYKNNLAVIWIGPHACLTTAETSPSGNSNEMSLATSMNIGHPALTDIYFSGQKVDPKNVYLLGIRDIESGEIDIAKSLNLELYDVDSIKDIGIENIINKVIESIRISDVDGVHLSFDINVMDQSLVSGSNRDISKGLDIEETKSMLSRFLSEKFVTSMDFVEFNPEIDPADMRTSKNCMKILDHIFKEL